VTSGDPGDEKANPGVDLCKPFRILIGVEGGGVLEWVQSVPIADIGKGKCDRTLRL
jgi:hypothetical protein